jgi:hypothetical protein
MKCKSFYIKETIVRKVIIITLLTDKTYEATFSSNFYSYDKFILNQNTHILVHALNKHVLPQKMNTRFVSNQNNYYKHISEYGNTIYFYYEPLTLPPNIKNFEQTKEIHPKQYCHPKQNMSYSLATRYYTNQMLKLSILSNYDFFIKLDADVRILKHIDLLTILSKHRPTFLHTKTFSNDNLLCEKNAFKISKSYCFLKKWKHPNLIYYSNFIGGDTKLFTSKIILDFSDFMWQHGWEYRWCDQTFWRYALLISNTSHNVLDMSKWRDKNFVHK